MSFSTRKPRTPSWGTGPHQRHIGNSPGRNPCLLAVQDVVDSILHTARAHPAGVRAKVRFRQTEAADRRALLQSRQPAVLLLVAESDYFQVHATTTPMEQVGGDYYDMVYLPDERFGSLSRTSPAMFFYVRVLRSVTCLATVTCEFVARTLGPRLTAKEQRQWQSPVPNNPSS